MSDLKRIKRKKLNRLGHTHCEDITPALPNKHYNGYLEVTEEKSDHRRRDLEPEMGTARFKYSWNRRRRLETELDVVCGLCQQGIYVK